MRYLLDFELDCNADGEPAENGNGGGADGDRGDGDRIEPVAVDRLLEDVSLLLFTIHDLEWIGDHAVNVAARTLYMVEGDSVLI